MVVLLLAAVVAASGVATVLLVVVMAAATAAAWAVAWGYKVVVEVETRSSCPTFVLTSLHTLNNTDTRQLPFQVGWQDLKDLFRQAGKFEPTFRNPPDARNMLTENSDDRHHPPR